MPLPAQDPGRAMDLACGSPAGAAQSTHRRPQRVHNLEADTRPASAVYASRTASPPSLQDSLPAAGCTSTGGGGRTLWTASKRFPVTFHPPFQDFACRKGRLRQAALKQAGRRPRLSRPLHPPHRHRQQPPRQPGRPHRPLPLEGLSHRRSRHRRGQAQDHEPHPRRVPAPLPAPRPARGRSFHRIRHFGLLAKGPLTPSTSTTSGP